MLQGAGGLQAQSVHHVAQIVCGAGTGESVPQKKIENASFICLQTLGMSESCTDICSELFGGVGAELVNEQDGVAVSLHGSPGDGAQPVVCGIVQLWKVIT